MKRPYDHLHRLISSMTKSEKRHFKIYSNRHVKGNENNYVRLFDLVEKQKKYDEEKIKKALHGSTFVKRLDVVKRYLFDLILEALTLYYNRSDLSFQFRLELNKALILHKKGLTKEARTILNKLELVAEVNNLYYMVLDVMHAQAQMTNSTDERKRIREKVENKIDDIKNNYEYLRIKLSLEEVTNKYGKCLPAELIFDFKKILEDPLMSSVSKAITIHSKSIYYGAKLKYYRLILDYDKENQYAVKRMRLWNEHPENIRLYFSHFSILSYAEVVANVAVTQAQLKDYESALETLKGLEIKADEMNIINNKATKESFLYHLWKTKLWIYNRSGDVDRAANLIKDIEKEVVNVEERLDKFFSQVYFSIAVSCFLARDHRSALYWINEILTQLKGDVRTDIQALSRLLFLIIHFDLNNNDLIEYQIISTYRYLLKKGGLNTFERMIIKFLKVNNYQDSRSLKKSFVDLKAQIEIAKEDDLVIRSNLDNFDLLSWLESKIEKKPLLDIIKNKAIN